MNQLVTENKFIEGIKQSILYGNREFLRSFQLRLEIKERNSSNSSNQHNKNTVDTTTVTCLAPPFQNIGFLETKWLEIIKELVEHGNKNILKNVELHLVMEERTPDDNNGGKEVTSGILDIKKEERAIGRGIAEASNHNNNNNNQSWFTRLR